MPKKFKFLAVLSALWCLMLPALAVTSPRAVVKQNVQTTIRKQSEVKGHFKHRNVNTIRGNRAATSNGITFTAFSPNGGGEPTGPLADAIKAKWESVDHFKEAFVKAGTSLFGSGWVWLAKDGNGQLLIKTYPNGGNPVRDNLTPLLGFDVWEHAYYLDYQNRRADHLKALWKIVDWNVVSQRFTDSRPEKRDEP